jgi:hypothetical protein
MVRVVVGVHLPHARQTGTQERSAQPICPHQAPAERSSVHVNRRAGPDVIASTVGRTARTRPHQTTGAGQRPAGSRPSR